MKRLLLFILFVLAGSTACQRYKYPFLKDIPATADVQAGQKLYMQNCQKCHPDGEAGLGPSIFYLPGFVKKFQARHGLGVMPEFDEEAISDEELDKIVVYLKVLD